MDACAGVGTGSLWDAEQAKVRGEVLLDLGVGVADPVDLEQVGKVAGRVSVSYKQDRSVHSEGSAYL